MLARITIELGLDGIQVKNEMDKSCAQIADLILIGMLRKAEAAICKQSEEAAAARRIIPVPGVLVNGGM